MEISASLVKELREKTGAGMMDCKKALTETEGNFDKAVDALRKKGLAAAAKRAGRSATEGSVQSYIHGEGRIGVLIEVNCETDFVARNDDFKSFVRDVAMHVAAASPQYVRPEEIPAAVIEREKEVIRGQMAQDPKNAGKPPQVLEKITEGKIQKFINDICLINQPFVKNPDVTVGALAIALVAKVGENISVRRFARFNLGEGLEKKSEE